MSNSRPTLALAALLAAAPLFAETTTESVVAVGGGGALVSGDRAAFQQTFQHKKDGYGGLESYALTRTTDDSIFKFDARLIPGDEDYRVAARWEAIEKYYVSAGYQTARTFYDGSGGYFAPKALTFSFFDEDLHLDRRRLWLEVGTLVPDKPQFRFRYERNERDGSKGSTRWGDSNLVGAPYGTRSISPAFSQFDEVQNVFTAEVERSTDTANWNAGARYERSTQANSNHTRRRPTEVQDRYVNSTDNQQTDLFSAHGYYERVVSEQLRYSGGGLFTTLDTNLSGGHIYGAGYDAPYDPAFARRQAFDVGYYALVGGSEMKQYVANANLVYEPAKNWSIRPTLKYENRHVSSVADYFDTTFASGTLAAVANPVHAGTRNKWNEFTEELAAVYSGWKNVSLKFRARVSQGTGDLVENSFIVPTSVVVINRDGDYERYGQHYSVESTWYPRAGLSVSAQLYYKTRKNDYGTRIDNTLAGSLDRYPDFITGQDFETSDGNLRLTWRPASIVSFVTRYDYQRSKINSSMKLLEDNTSGRQTAHVVSESITLNPTARLFVNASATLTYDQMEQPKSARFLSNSDSNYVSGNLGAGYALGQVTDVYLDYNYYRADNFADNSLVSLPMLAGQKQESTFATWTRRQNDHLIYTVKLGYATNRDETTSGLNNYRARVIYGRVQYRF